MDTVTSLKNWQWLALLNGLPIIPFGIVNYFCFGTVPETVQWLSNVEKDFLTEILLTDVYMANNEPESNNCFSWHQFYRDANTSIMQRGHIISGGAVSVALIVTYIQRACLKKENNRRNHLSLVEHKREESVEEPCDWVIINCL
ncbi:unnamed protein product [Rotaria socialis]|uniref:Uncharacterized protein n=1 Tax=Rotaria socialis TaxID=392032 RepID=A0A818TL90_9BILA|nr:unnamed protein product [Rotaria socialis]